MGPCRVLGSPGVGFLDMIYAMILRLGGNSEMPSNCCYPLSRMVTRRPEIATTCYSPLGNVYVKCTSLETLRTHTKLG